MSRVLIIEDETVARRQLAQLFRFEGFDVIEAESGQPGIAAAAAQPPDLVICDVMMPGTDGFGVLEALRQMPATRLTPFIFLTAKAGGQDVRQGMGKGADDYITKPFDPETLLAAARQRLEKRRLQLEEAQNRATDAGLLAAAALPREMEGCLGQLERISEMFGVRYGDDPQATEMRRAMREEVSRLRAMSKRLHLYAELPSLYARRFSEPSPALSFTPLAVALETAQSVAKQWARAADLSIAAPETPATMVPLPEDSLVVLTRELVENACKFSPPASNITVAIDSKPAYWKLAVSDGGPGIAPDQISKISAFRQHWTGTERPPGLGLGLVLVQSLARLHSGETLIENQSPSGARVSVMIPAEC